MTQSPQNAADQPDQPDADIVLDEVTAAKVALLRTTHQPQPEGQKAPDWITKHPLIATGAAFAAGAIVGGVPLARKLLLGAALFSGRHLVTRFLRK